MKTVFQFSGGRDSLACLYALEPFWDGILVVWGNGGAPSPALLALMAKVKELVPHFLEATGDSVGMREEHGNPDADTWMSCCFANIWQPMHKASVEQGATTIIRGAKRCDPINFIKPGHTEDGITYIFPIWGWSDKMVIDSLAGRPLQPAYPHDCHDCPVTKICDRPELAA
jgi:3'-phosphoadenosine 5'-phosphosulfate sulfotransferase (PAPS reductase)/FAD synthetase